jgi:hypothetical protein
VTFYLPLLAIIIQKKKDSGNRKRERNPNSKRIEKKIKIKREEVWVPLLL